MWSRPLCAIGSILLPLCYLVYVVIFSNVLWALWKLYRISFMNSTRKWPSSLIEIDVNGYRTMPTKMIG